MLGSRVLARCAGRRLGLASPASVLTANRLSLSSGVARVFRSQLPDIELPSHLSYPQFILGACERHASRTALTCVDTGRSVTYSDLRTGVSRAASGFVKLGLNRGDVVCIFSRNSLHYPAAMFAVMSAGGVLTTASPDFTAGELAAHLQSCRAKFLLTALDRFDVAAEAAKASGCVREIFLTDEAPAAPGTRRFVDLFDDDGRCDPSGSMAVDQARDVAAILCSSGTTGLPKGVMLTHRNLIANVQQSHDLMHECPGEKLLATLPFYHIYGQVVVLAFALRNGFELSIMGQFDPDRFLATLQDHRLTMAHVVPPIFLFLAAHPAVEKYDLSALRRVICGAAPLKADTEDAFRRRFPKIDVAQGWGLTETSPVLTMVPPPSSVLRKPKPGSVGIVVPSVELRVADTQTGSSLGLNEVGQLFARGVNVMKGYFENPLATAESINADGWLATGDVGHIDEDGYVFISDRLKELIKVKGLQVAPAELEALLLTCPDVTDAGVVGRPDERAGELPVAFVVAREGSRLSETDVQRWVAERVAPHKQVAGGVRFVSAVPRSASGKILRKQLRALLAA